MNLENIKPRSEYVDLSPPLPLNIELYQLQVGGHGMLNNNKYQILSDGNGTLYKPVQNFPKGEKEILFYQKVFNSFCQDKTLLELRKFIPEYRGLFSCANPERENLYLGIEDLLSNMSRPAVADVKVGQVSYEPNAPDEKKKVEIDKYLYRKDVGFLLTGLVVHHPQTLFLDRYHGRKLNSETVYTEGLAKFLGGDTKRACVLANLFVVELLKLLDWFESQTSMAFIASSILLAYESLPTANGTHEDEPVEKVLVKFIDFTHVLPMTNNDSNCIYGVKSLIEYFRRLQ